ncbi:hypothetical protein FALBO_5913 [Fusarium albosuccineum]|uniref:Mid2 domain-containing protein n=1 Tax=Fusarium albosuccineum TaxID=1237068 RepID=A0A8H4LFM0_9HYPO|nr:hypothetical protein FALBO_5913 [Fusarium albosuccineum]
MFWLLLLSQLSLSYSHVVPVTRIPSPSNRPRPQLQQRAISTELSTCGYLDGDPEKIRTADSGFNCRVDTRNGLWGFCPTTVLVATDCGLAGSCVDEHDCSDGCGMTDSTDLTTFTCKSKSFCSMALLTFGVDQTYSYIACGPSARTDHYYITPTVDAKTTSTEASTSTAAADTSQTSEATKDRAQSSTNAATESSSPSQESAAEPTESESTSSGGSSAPLGPIIGGVIGGLVVICGTTIAIIWILRRNRGKEDESGTTMQDVHLGGPEHSAYQEAKHPQQLGGWGPQELPGNTHYGRQNAVELAG